jgi:hypothetical protein
MPDISKNEQQDYLPDPLLKCPVEKLPVFSQGEPGMPFPRKEEKVVARAGFFAAARFPGAGKEKNSIAQVSGL